MSVVHIVLFQFRSLDTPEEIQEVIAALALHPRFLPSLSSRLTRSKVIDGFLALNTACVNPQTNQPYLKVVGGRELGPEGGMQVRISQPDPT